MRLLFILLIISLLFLLGWLYYNDYTTCCTNGLKNKEQPPAINKLLLFQWSSPEPAAGADWQQLKDSLVALTNDTSKLEITAWYCIDEVGPITPDSFGSERLIAVRALFPEVEDKNIILIAREVRCDSQDKKLPFEAAGFSIRKVTKNIIETEEETTIYFPDNSTRKPEAADVENYLNNVAARVIASGESILLTGFTDTYESKLSNISLGRKRAEIIRNYLVSRGVAEDKIKVTSEGEQSPVGDNSTPEGQAKKRRITLQIIP